MATFLIGDSAEPTCRFSVAGVLTDPTTVTLKVRDPAGTETTYTLAGATVTKASTGVYYRDVALSVAGRWVFRWLGTGTVPAAVESALDVAPSLLTTP